MEFNGTERFELLGKLGEGGMGIVYEALDRTRGMPVAIKTLRNLEGDNLKRFKREFRALHNLSHPNIIHLYELIAEDGAWFLTMELVKGQDFIRYVRNGRAIVPQSWRQHTSSMDTRTVDDSPTLVGDEPATPAPQRSILPARPAVTAPLDEVVDIARLRHTLGQLADALQALHTANLVHRDLKPANVRVTPDGRVVLMDFGIVSELTRLPGDEPDRMVGTPSFMAPEQVFAARPTAASDWYSFGVMMYAALAGRLPFQGDKREIMRLKGEVDPWPPSTFTHGIPADLEALCMELLARDADDRPRGADVLTRLGIAVSEAATSGEFPVLDTASKLFVGRQCELGELRSSYTKVIAGATLCVFIDGPPGIGRSTLARRFLYEIRTLGSRRPLILAGHSRARESLAYKAFDGIIDDLASHLSGLTDTQRASLLDDDAAAIGWLFPALMPALESVLPQPRSQARDDTESVHDPHEQRSRAIAALRTLIGRLASKRALILYTDDIQWADRDSLDLLLALLRSPAPAKLLVLATLRTDEFDDGEEREADSHLQHVIETLEKEVDCHHIHLGPLSEGEQRELMLRMASLPEFEGVGRHLEAPLWRESAGNPMLLAELARSTSDTPHDLAARGMLHLDDVIWSRFGKLPEDARALMECIVLAGEALPLTVLAAASGLSKAACERASSTLRVSHMVRIGRSDHEPWLAAYHYKVCEAIRERLSPDVRAAGHRGVAEALRDWGAAPHALMAEQWMAAGEPAQALHHRFEAAQQAAELLALDRAASFYKGTIELVPEPHPDDELARLCCRAHLGLAEIMVHDHGDRKRALELLEHARQTAEELQLLPELALIHHLDAILHFPHGDLDRCLAEHEASRAYARQTSSPRLEALALSGEGDALYARGKIRSAHARYEACLALCQEHELRDVAVQSRVSLSMTLYFQAKLGAALRVCNEAADEAARIRYQRSELIARCFTLPWVLFDMGRMHHASHSLERAYELCRKLDAHHFQPVIWSHQARISSMKGRRRRARECAEKAVDAARGQHEQFFGPVALAVLAQVANDAATRERALDEAERILESGAWGHSHLMFYRDAMDVALNVNELARVDAYAEALERYTEDEPLPWSRFFAARARALSAYARGEPMPGELARLRAEARQLGMHTPAIALEKALSGRGIGR